MYLYYTSALVFTLVNHVFSCILPFSESPDCYFEDGSCGWAGEEDWEMKTSKDKSKNNLPLLSKICHTLVGVKKRDGSSTFFTLYHRVRVINVFLV